jgi:hypothetical protein
MVKTPIQVVDTTNATPNATPQDAPISIEKPAEGGLERFMSKRAPNIAGVETLLTALAHHKISEAGDFVRLHPSEEYWSPEFCFVNVPIIGQKRDLLHLIDEELAMNYLSSKKIQRFRLALASKPHDNFFLCHVPSTNLDNPWNMTAVQACLMGRTQWVQVESRKADGAEGYKIDHARDPDAFPAPNWPKRTLDDLVTVTFNGRMIDRHDHPALLRLIGAKQNLT